LAGKKHCLSQTQLSQSFLFYTLFKEKKKKKKVTSRVDQTQSQARFGVTPLEVSLLHFVFLSQNESSASS
jgi:hypothetical protein